MKIEKRTTVQACDAVEVEAIVPEICPYTAAVEHIKAAIEELGAVAKEDALARESIANLSVVLFDLKT